MNRIPAIAELSALLLLRTLAASLGALPLALPTHAAESQPAPLTVEALAFDRVTATDLTTLKNLLEKAGWPESHVRAVLNVEVQRRLNPDPVLRLEDLKPFHFWHTGPDA